MSGFTRHRRSRRVIATFTGFEADLLRSLAGQLVELLRNESATLDDRDPFEQLMDFSGPTAPPEPNVLEAIGQMQAQGTTRIPGPGNDVADPDQTELAYAEVPTAAMCSLLEALDA